MPQSALAQLEGSGGAAAMTPGSEEDAAAAALARRIRRRAALRELNSRLSRRLADAVEALHEAREGAPGPSRGPAHATHPWPPPAAPELLPWRADRAGISFADLLHVQGRGRRGTLDLSRMCMRQVAEACRRSITGGTAASGAADGVTWFVQTRRAAATGVGLSVGSALGTPACMASLLLLWLSVQLECGLLVCESARLLSPPAPLFSFPWPWRHG